MDECLVIDLCSGGIDYTSHQTGLVNSGHNKYYMISISTAEQPLSPVDLHKVPFKLFHNGDAECNTHFYSMVQPKADGCSSVSLYGRRLIGSK